MNTAKIIESWHSLYPNSKRKRKNKKNKRYLLFKLLDNLIELGYENNILVYSSIFVEFGINKSNNEYLQLRYDTNTKLFDLEIIKNGISEKFEKLEFDYTIIIIKNFVEDKNNSSNDIHLSNI